MTLSELIALHTSLYPGMEMDDCLKLVYQSALGGGHLIEDEGAFVARLAEELAQPGVFAASPGGPTPVGGGQCRVHLSALAGGPAVPTLTALCARAARAREDGGPQRLQKLLAQLRDMAQAGALPWPDAEARIDAFIAAGCPQPHHSQRFTRLYAPHYRLMETSAAAFLPVFAAVDRALAQKPHALVGIDGMCASGKSGLSGLLAEVYGCGVVAADDFFLQPHQRTQERLAQPGGNIDYERLAPVAQQAGEALPFRYQTYDCQAGELGEWRQVPGGPLTVLEGAYCLHPAVNAPCDVRVFLSVDAAVQRRRILARSGPGLAARFNAEWIPMENAYFGAFAVREGCDVAIDTTGLWEQDSPQ